MTQQALPLGPAPYRVEYPIAVITWREADARREVVLHPHCVDHAWPWWAERKQPWEL